MLTIPSFVQSVLQQWASLIIHVYFKPTALRDQLHAIAPELTAEPLPQGVRAFHTNPALRRFQLRVLFYTMLTPWLVILLCGVLLSLVGIHFHWYNSINGVASGMGFGLFLSLTWGLTLGLTWGLAHGMTLGISWIVALGIAGGLSAGIGNNIVTSIVLGFAIGFAGSLAVTLESGLAWGVIGGPIVGLVGGLAAGMSNWLALDTLSILLYSIAVLMGVLRLPFYPVECIIAFRGYRNAQKITCEDSLHNILNAQSMDIPDTPIPHDKNSPNTTSNIKKKQRKRYKTPVKEEPIVLRDSSRQLAGIIDKMPLCRDELLILPHPWLVPLLVHLARCHIPSGLRSIARCAGNPFQRWAAQRAIRLLIEQHSVPLFLVIHQLLTIAEPFHTLGGSEQRFASDTTFTTKLLLAEIAGVPPIRNHTDERLGFSDGVVRSFTAWLRQKDPSPNEPVAITYLYLLTTDAAVPEMLHRVMPIFHTAQKLPYGTETYHMFAAIESAMACVYLAEIAQCNQVFEPLLETPTPLRHDIMQVFHTLNDITTNATVFLSGEHPVNLRDALLKAQGKIEEARRLASTLHEPEQHILCAVIEHWRQLFITEGKQIAEGIEVEVLPNPYVAGRALAPTDGRLFVGRQEVFRLIEETLHSGVTIVLYGQRRIGKTSLLLRIREHLSHTLLPVYFNLQLLQVDTTAGLLFSIATTITEQLSKTDGCRVPMVPTLDTFGIEPFLTLNQFLADVERSVQLGQRVVLIFDEFEELERQVARQKVDDRIFTFLRGLTQTRHGFVLIFAGLHTLEQMSYDYWHPFFLSVKPIKVSYLSQAEAWSLITSPADNFPLKYDKAATDRMIAITRGQPYLLQALSFNLIMFLNNPLYRSNRATEEHVVTVLEQTLESGTYYFEDYFWGYSTPNEQLALAIIADSATNMPENEYGWVHFTVIANRIGRETARHTLTSLCARDVLEEQTNNTHLLYRFQVELLRLWVARTKPLARMLQEQHPTPPHTSSVVDAVNPVNNLVNNTQDVPITSSTEHNHCE